MCEANAFAKWIMVLAMPGWQKWNLFWSIYYVYIYNIKNYTTFSSTLAFWQDKSSSADIEYNSTGIFNFIILPHKCSNHLLTPNPSEHNLGADRVVWPNVLVINIAGPIVWCWTVQFVVFAMVTVQSQFTTLHIYIVSTLLVSIICTCHWCESNLRTHGLFTVMDIKSLCGQILMEILIIYWSVICFSNFNVIFLNVCLFVFQFTLVLTWIWAVYECTILCVFLKAW